MKREVVFIIGCALAAAAIGLALMTVAKGQFVVPYATDEAFPVALVDETDGYTAETEKKYGDTTLWWVRPA